MPCACEREEKLAASEREPTSELLRVRVTACGPVSWVSCFCLFLAVSRSGTVPVECVNLCVPCVSRIHACSPRCTESRSFAESSRFLWAAGGPCSAGRGASRARRRRARAGRCSGWRRWIRQKLHASAHSCGCDDPRARPLTTLSRAAHRRPPETLSSSGRRRTLQRRQHPLGRCPGSRA